MAALQCPSPVWSENWICISLRWFHHCSVQYIRDAFVPQVKAEVSNFKRFRKLIDRLITLSIERSQLRIKADKKQ
jgi:hypothetical protein